MRRLPRGGVFGAAPLGGRASGHHVKAPAAPVVGMDRWKAVANVLDDAMSPQTIVLGCLTDRVGPGVGPKERDVDEGLWHQAAMHARRGLNVPARTSGP
jgi:hypothetical protein